ncbi:MAG: hypothetical protein WC443_13200 [Desulfobaccales bacterium]
MKKIRVLTAIATAILLSVSLNAYADTISGGVPDSDLTARQLRDGASGIHFIDLDSFISGSGWITSWSIFAQSSIVPDWVANFESRQVGLMIYRNNGSGYTVVGESPLETIPAGASAWDRIYTFSDLGTGIQVQQGDLLGWYYPFQGADSGPNPGGYPYYPNDTNPGGVIAFDKILVSQDGHNVRWKGLWGSQQPPELAVGDSVAYSWFDSGPESEGGLGRIYSLNVSGSTNPVPVPPSLLLLGSGLLGLEGWRRFRKS